MIPSNPSAPDVKPARSDTPFFLWTVGVGFLYELCDRHVHGLFSTLWAALVDGVLLWLVIQICRISGRRWLWLFRGASSPVPVPTEWVGAESKQPDPQTSSWKSVALSAAVLTLVFGAVFFVFTRAISQARLRSQAESLCLAATQPIADKIKIEKGWTISLHGMDVSIDDAGDGYSCVIAAKVQTQTGELVHTDYWHVMGNELGKPPESVDAQLFDEPWPN